jgi:SAM-dependent methyltransferase
VTEADLKPLRTDPTAARTLIDQATFVWHQRFELAPGVLTPGVNDMASLYSLAGLPHDLTGASVLDIGTTNGGGAFEAERRGASRVVAVDILDPTWFGFDRLRDFLGSTAEFRRGSVYELSSLLRGERFDIVLFWGVLYHLRHPLLALDEVRAVADDRVYVETAVSDWELPSDQRRRALARFYRRDELGADPSNWFAPTAALLSDWLLSSGLEVIELQAFGGDDGAARAHASCVVLDGEPEWRELSYEAPLRVVVPAMHDGADDVAIGATRTQSWVSGPRADSRLTYAALERLSARWDAVEERTADGPFPPGDLSRYELRVFSQNGEDGVLAEILRRIGVSNRHFVEVGIDRGAEGNCVFLADVLGWSGVFLEADPDLHARLEAKYRWSDVVRTRNAQVEPGNVERLLREVGVPDAPDVCSIDVDGADYWIWEAMASIRPRVMVIECNTAIDPDRRLVQPADLDGPWQGTDFYGATVGALADLGASKGYHLVHVDLTGVNAFFVRSKDALGWPNRVPRRGPNLWLSSVANPPDPTGRSYIDLDVGEP